MAVSLLSVVALDRDRLTGDVDVGAAAVGDHKVEHGISKGEQDLPGAQSQGEEPMANE